MINLRSTDTVLTKFLSKVHQQVFFGTQKHPISIHQMGNYRWYHVFELTPVSDDLLVLLHAPSIVVCIGLLLDHTLKNPLQISYFIKKTPLIDLTINNDNFKQDDFLWQENCLECFVEYNRANDYFEINVALDGRHNVYHFDNYRTPNVMPPRQAKLGDVLVDNLAHASDVVDGFYSRHINLLGNKAALPTRLNPTAILYVDGQGIFYANTHANPPDFHDKRHWVLC